MERFDLQLGVPLTVRGVYVDHWEVPRLELRVRHRLRPVCCGVEAAPGVAASVFEAAGVQRPENWRFHRGVRFDVVAHVTPLEFGRFGHRGIQRWRLRVDEWVSVSARPGQLLD